ncbi:MAG: glycosyltransferase family 9 protein [Bdellovibrionales bacterium]|nr:glycosyltransferase family 9 protein [Bdellovibrionales bacterium]
MTLTPRGSALPFVVSRADRLGDLILSLPVLGLLRRAGCPRIALHVSSYARGVGEWAQRNGLCDDLWTAQSSEGYANGVGLALVHVPAAREIFGRAGIQRTMGPRSKLSALWSYTRSVGQRRSRVAMSEMQYNLELAREALRWVGMPVPEFVGLPALKIPPEWRSLVASHTVLVVSNRGSAADLPLADYLTWARKEIAAGRSVDLLVSGDDAEAKVQGIEQSGILREGARMVRSLPAVRDLIAYLGSAEHVVSSSTGPLHLAHAAGVPVTGIYPRQPVTQSFARWRPDGYWHSAPVRYVEF